MKLFHGLALVAVFLLVADSVVPSQAWRIWGGDSKKDEPNEALKTAKNEALKQEIPQKDEEQGGGAAEIDEIDNLDSQGDEIYDVPIKPNTIHTQSSLASAQNFPDEEGKQKIQISEDMNEDGGLTADIPVINYLPAQAPSNQSVVATYPHEPAQSEFVEGHGSHPTQSQGADPRFARRRECQEGQYLCRKAHPQQEHIRCIPNNWKCNGVRDCEENDDEEGCAINVHRTQPNQCIAPYQYTCYGTGINGIPAACVDSRKLCDGTYDCTYGDDESKENCAQYATRREETVVQPGQSPDLVNGNAHTQPQTQQAPQYNPYPAQSQQPAAQPQQPQQPQQPPQQECAPARNEEYVKRLEWIDRCFRSCLKY